MINTKIINIVLNSKYNQLSNNYIFESTRKNKTCGDIINIRISGTKKRIMTYEAKSCFFTKASAEILSKNISKYDFQKLNELKKDIRLFFEKKDFKITKNLKPFEIILNKKNKVRTDCILLPILATLEALNDSR